MPLVPPSGFPLSNYKRFEVGTLLFALIIVIDASEGCGENKRVVDKMENREGVGSSPLYNSLPRATFLAPSLLAFRRQAMREL